MRLIQFLLMAVCLTGSHFLGAQTHEQHQDIPNCKDHPLVARIPGFYIAGCQHNFNPVDMRMKAGTEEGSVRKLEGVRTHLEYQHDGHDAHPAAAQIISHYEEIVTKLGGKLLFQDNAAGEATYRFTRSHKDYWVSIHAQNAGKMYTMNIVEVARKPELSANDMLVSLEGNGFVPLYIEFENGKADIRPESMHIIDQIVELMNANLSLVISVEGYTDNAGSPEASKALSLNRAKAVMNAVVARGISKSRLLAAGHGQDNPIGDNRTEEGRAKNRRIELVKK
ncbi:MAG: OmpA family protein [Cytophagaceae bacterium]